MRKRAGWWVTAFWIAQQTALGCLAIPAWGWFLTALARQVNRDFGSYNTITVRGRQSPFEVPATEIKTMMVAGFCGIVFLAGVAVLISLMLNRWLPVPALLRWILGAVLGVLPFVVYWFTFTQAA